MTTPVLGHPNGIKLFSTGGRLRKLVEEVQSLAGTHLSVKPSIGSLRRQQFTRDRKPIDDTCYR